MNLNASIPLAVNRSVLYTIDGDSALALIEQILYTQTRSSRAGDKETITKGKRFIDSKRSGQPIEPEVHEQAVNLLARQLDAFVDNLDLIRWMVDTDQPQLSDILEVADKDPNAFAEDTGMSPQLVRDCVSSNLLRQSWIDSMLLQVA